MAWIELHQTLPTNKKLIRIASLLKITEEQAIGHLCKLWLWALDNAQGGHLIDFLNAEIARVSGWTKNPDVFVNALLSAGFLDEDMQIHDWYSYAGRLIERRGANTARMREARKHRSTTKTENSGTHTEQNASVQRTFCARAPNMLSTCDELVAGATVPYRTVPNRTVPKNTYIVASNATCATTEQRFNEFWKSYPKKVGKAAVLTAWKKVNPDDALFDKIMKSLDWQTKSKQWTDNNGQFIPNPLTWINQGRWDNEPMETGTLHEESFNVDEFVETAMKRGIYDSSRNNA